MKRLASRLAHVLTGAPGSSKLLAALAFCVLQVLTSRAVAAPSVTAQELEAEIGAKLEAVPELRFLKTEAEKLGVQAHLFGGTAASFAHYVKQDLLRRQGRLKASASRFDYEFTSIFRSTQDLDVVVDGPRDRIRELTQIMRNRYPHFIGDKANKWELRSLRESEGRAGQPGYKEALLASPDFLLQNTDSHSTGLIRVTNGEGEARVRDLRDWDSKLPQFEKDVLEGKLHFYLSDRHFETPRAAAGKNPEIFSVVRALTKALQYDLQLDSGALEQMKAIVARTDFDGIRRDYENSRRLIDIGKKLFLHSVDVERSWNFLEAMGLRQPLMTFDSPRTTDSMAWLMNKEPLRTKKVGQGDGETADAIARRLGLKSLEVAHETRSFLAYESITRSRAGVPNFFVSRPDGVGEAAISGWGTYTQLGRFGARGTEITVRMVIDPRARSGSDFVVVGDYYILRNRAAAKVIPESMQLSSLGYLMQLADGRSFKGDLALLEAFRRKLSRNPEVLSKADRKAIRELVETNRRRPDLMAEVARMRLDVGYGPTDFFDSLSKLSDSDFAASDHARAFTEAIHARPLTIEEKSTMKAIIEKSKYAAGLLAALGPSIDIGLRAEPYIEAVVKVGPENMRVNQYVPSLLEAAAARAREAAPEERVKIWKQFRKLGAPLSSWQMVVEAFDAVGAGDLVSKPDRETANLAKALARRIDAPSLSADFDVVLKNLWLPSQFLEIAESAGGKPELIDALVRNAVHFGNMASTRDVDYMKTVFGLPKEFFVALLDRKASHMEHAHLLFEMWPVKKNGREVSPKFPKETQELMFKLLAEKFIRENADYDALTRLLIDAYGITKHDSWGPRANLVETHRPKPEVLATERSLVVAALDKATSADEVLRLVSYGAALLKAESDNDVELLKKIAKRFGEFPMTNKSSEHLDSLYHESLVRPLLMAAAEKATTAEQMTLILTVSDARIERYRKNNYGHERDVSILQPLWKKFGSKFVSMNPKPEHWEQVAKTTHLLKELEPGVGPFAKTKGPPKRALSCKSIFAS